MAYFKKNWPADLHAEVQACAEEVAGQVADVINPHPLMQDIVERLIPQTEQGNSSAIAHCQKEKNLQFQEAHP